MSDMRKDYPAKERLIERVRSLVDDMEDAEMPDFIVALKAANVVMSLSGLYPELTEKADELRAMGLGGTIIVDAWSRHPIGSPMTIMWAVFGDHEGEQRQISCSDTWDEVLSRVRDIVTVDPATRELLLSL